MSILSRLCLFLFCCICVPFVLASEDAPPPMAKQINEDAPPPTEEQIKRFQAGDILALSRYLGFHNRVLMACVYRREWTPPVKGMPKGFLTLRAVVVQSLDKTLPVGKHIEWRNAAIGAPDVSQKAYVEPGDGELYYLVEATPEEEEVHKGFPYFAEPDRFQVNDKTIYPSVRFFCDVRPEEDDYSPPAALLR